MGTHQILTVDFGMLTSVFFYAPSTPLRSCTCQVHKMMLHGGEGNDFTANAVNFHSRQWQREEISNTASGCGRPQSNAL